MVLGVDDFLAGEHRIERVGEELVGGRKVGSVGGGLGVDRAVVDELAFLIDDEHVWGGLGSVGLADLAIAIGDDVSGFVAFGGGEFAEFRRLEIAFLAFCGRANGEPNDSSKRVTR